MAKYDRIAAAINSTVWFIEPRRGQAIAEAMVNRLEAGAASPGSFLTEDELEANKQRAAVQKVPMAPTGKNDVIKQLAIMPVMGTIMPRGNLMSDMSGGGSTSLTRFQNEFQALANDPQVGAILLEIDSPGGSVDLVEETAQMIRDARRASRPIVALANTMAASAAYWLAAATDEIVVTPSGTVGSIGVFGVHQEMAEAARASGIKTTYIFEGPRKVEGNPFEALSDEARGAWQAEVRSTYERFTGDVARWRGVSQRVVMADPETAKDHFGGGRAYSTGQLKQFGLIGRNGMVNRVATKQQTVDRLLGRSRRVSTSKAKLALM